MRWLLLPLLCGLVFLSWYLPNRLVDPPGGNAAEKFSSLSFEAYRSWESPLKDRFPTKAEADSDMALVAREASAVRTYAAIEGEYDIAALAQKHGVKLWQGIWLGGDRAKNEQEMSRAIALAHKYPGTIIRVVVGNEVLLRRDLPPSELIADIDRVKRAVAQPVAYADVWNFWQDFPEVARHVDIMLIHLLPYWEDVPTGIDHAVAYAGDVYRKMRAAFPGKQIAIGEIGWPSQGRERADAVPSLVNEARFLREFLALSHREHFDYNFIEAFDQSWKYASEGIVGANWGIFTADRRVKIPLAGGVRNDPDWGLHAGLAVGFGLALVGFGLREAPRPVAASRRVLIECGGMALGAALGAAVAGVFAALYDVHLQLAGAVNLVGQGALAVLATKRLAGTLPAAVDRTGRDTSRAVRDFLLRLRVPAMPDLFEDLCFVFVWTAAVLQMLLFCDGRYREFPLTTFAVPLLVTLGRVALRDSVPRRVGLEEFLVGAFLAIGGIGSLILEGPWNAQSLVWNGCALLLSADMLREVGKKGRVFFF
jgi:exo-beta-1,3-glucanase (GH17 family)